MHLSMIISLVIQTWLIHRFCIINTISGIPMLLNISWLNAFQWLLLDCSFNSGINGTHDRITKQKWQEIEQDNQHLCRCRNPKSCNIPWKSFTCSTMIDRAKIEIRVIISGRLLNYIYYFQNSCQQNLS